jgi:copper resistance protein C
MKMRKSLLALAAILAVLMPGTPAWAHAELVATDPPRDATLAAAPATVTLTFSEQLDPDYATIVVSDAAGARIPATGPVVTAAAGTVTLSRSLANGVHRVAYRVVSVDGHTVQGSYTFTVADPALPPPSGAAVAALPAPAGSGGIPVLVLIALVALAVILTATALFLYASKRATTLV